jgi:hypothetical protein
MSILGVMKFFGILDEKDMYMKDHGGGKNLRLVGDSMLKQDSGIRNMREHDVSGSTLTQEGFTPSERP